MPYIHSRGEERTGFQERAPWSPEIDLQCDFVMVYGIDPDMPARVREYREKGYVVHLMTGTSWGDYKDYLEGRWDGHGRYERRPRRDESQHDRQGQPILHGKDVPYLSPTVAFSAYLTEKLLPAVGAGVEAVHLEEPEFWDYGGYSPAFQREYRLFYREEWQPPHSSLDARYKAARLKAWLYTRTIERVSAALKEYAMARFGRVLRFYVPTHSLLNYAQWKILSPESALIDVPSVDGYIAQIWTGTSRVTNVCQGVARERTFETAFLEYGIMQELCRGTGRRMWLLHDPIEDWPEHTWEDYRKNYQKTLVASLLHPMVSRYEICPWPNRVFNGVYPKKAGRAEGTIPTRPMEGAKPIPKDYASLLCGVVQMLADMEQPFSFEGNFPEAGILLSDSALYQRAYPDGVLPDPERSDGEALSHTLHSLAVRLSEGEDTRGESRALLKEIAGDGDKLLEFAVTSAFPGFYGMALPLLKYGLPVRPVQLDNVRRFAGYLEAYKLLLLSYEYQKPQSPDVNAALAAWVREGGTLFYVGDGRDPYHRVSAWWNEFGTAAEHLFSLLELPPHPADGIYPAGKGRIAVYGVSPAALCAGDGEAYRDFVRRAMSAGGEEISWQNHLTLKRGPYLISAVMDESCTETPKVFSGLFADMLAEGFPICTERAVPPGESAILFDFRAIRGLSARIVGTSARVFSLTCGETGFSMELKAADRISAYTRVRLPHPVAGAEAVDEEGEAVPLRWEWDAPSQTALFGYESRNRKLTVRGQFA